MASVIFGKKTEGSVGIRRGQGNLLTVEQDWHYIIQSDQVDPSSNQRTALLYDTPGVPLFNTNYGGLFLESADATRREELPFISNSVKSWWDCTYHLSSQPSEGNDRDQNGNQQTGAPTAWVPLVELSFEDYEEVFRQGLPIAPSEEHPSIGGNDEAGYNAQIWVNSAGQPFESGFVLNHRIVTRRFTQFEPSSRDLDTILEWHNRLNDREYLGKPKRTLRLMLDGVTLGTYYGTRCYRCDFTLAYKPTDWRLKQNDAGWHYRDSNGDLQPFFDKANPPNQVLGSLNGQGEPAANEREPARLYYKEFEDMDIGSIIRITT